MAIASPHTSASLRSLGYSDQGGRPHGIQIMVHHDNAYIGQARYGDNNSGFGAIGWRQVSEVDNQILRVGLLSIRIVSVAIARRAID